MVVWTLCVSEAQAAKPRVISSDETGVTVEVNGLDYALIPVDVEGTTFQQLSIPRGVVPPRSGQPAVPVIGSLIGIPFGIEPRIEILDAEYVIVPDVLLLPVPAAPEGGRPATPRADPAAYGTDGWFPSEAATITRTGTIRDQRVVAVSLRPVQYNPVQRSLRVATRLRIRIVFDRPAGSRPVARRPAPSNEGFNRVYSAAVLNANQAAGWRSRLPSTPWPSAIASWIPIVSRTHRRASARSTKPGSTCVTLRRGSRPTPIGAWRSGRSSPPLPWRA